MVIATETDDGAVEWFNTRRRWACSWFEWRCPRIANHIASASRNGATTRRTG